MKRVIAAQQIYGNLEERQSPSGRGGFQTILYSRAALTETEVEDVEARLVYFRSEREAVKLVFFVMDSGKAVVGRITPLAAVDSLGRQGPYLGHCLIFTRHGWETGALRPLALCLRFPFFERLADALAGGDLATGDIAPAAVASPPGSLALELEAAGRWSADSLRSLALLALRARTMAEERLSVAFVGEPEKIESALLAAFLAVPGPMLIHCAFDTHFYRCNPVASYYWAVGLPERPASPRFVVVDAAALRVHTETPPAAATCYERWALHLIGASHLDFLAEHREAAFSLCEWLERGAPGPFPAEDAPDRVVESVCQVNPARVSELVHARLIGFPAALGALCANALIRKIPARLLLQKVAGGFDAAELLAALDEIYAARGFQAPPAEDIQAVESLLRGSDHWRLRLVCLCWRRRMEELRRDLAALDDDSYHEFLAMAQRYRLAGPLPLLIPGRGAAFLDACLSSSASREIDLVDLVSALLAADDPALLARLIPWVSGGSEKQLRSLDRMAAQRPDVPDEFSRALAAAIGALPPEKSLKDVVRGWFRQAQK